MNGGTLEFRNVSTEFKKKEVKIP